MNTKNINFDNKKVKKSVFYTDKTVFQVDNIDVSKILLSKKEPYGTKTLKYFIAFNDNDVIRPLCLRLYKWSLRMNLRMNGYTKKS